MLREAGEDGCTNRDATTLAAVLASVSTLTISHLTRRPMSARMSDLVRFSAVAFAARTRGRGLRSSGLGFDTWPHLRRESTVAAGNSRLAAVRTRPPAASRG